MLLYPKTRDEWLTTRHQFVSSTDSPDLFDVGYRTRLALYYEKREPEPTLFEATERMELGLVNERSIATFIARKFGVRVRALNAYATRQSRMGASFDFEVIAEDTNVKEVDDDSLRIMYRDKGAGILEIKTVDVWIFRDEWSRLDNGGYEAPAHIEIQLQHGLHCIERAWGAIGVCVGGNRLEVLIRNRNEDIGAAIEKRVALFWDWVAKGTPPPERLPEDIELIKRLLSHAEPDEVFDATGKPDIERMVKTYRIAREQEKKYKLSAELAQVAILKEIGTASKVITAEHNISCGMVKATHIEYDREAYRNFRVTPKKAAKEPAK